jgi:hypothetical protein
MIFGNRKKAAMKIFIAAFFRLLRPQINKSLYFLIYQRVSLALD